MAYYREWDRGKDNWNDASWSGTNIRQRDEDYSGDGKRRKFNNGGYQGYEGAPGFEETGNAGGYRHHDNSQDYGHDDRSRGGAGGFPKKRLIPSEPSPHVIFLGLDPDFTEADLQAYLTSNGCTLETVTIIRDRSSGISKGFGFAQFANTELARAFVDPLFPFIQVPPPASHGASAATTFYQALEKGLPHNGRKVKIDYSQSASPHDKGRSRGNANDGTRDIGNTQGAVLLFRGLDSLSGPQAIYQAMLYSSGPGKQGAKGMKRIILIKDKVTMASFGFAFVEFVDVQSASAVLAATMSPHIHPAGFRISDKPVAASFAHPYSFQPVTDFLSRDEACLPSSPNLGGGVEGTWVRYWDESSTVAILDFKVEEPVKPVVQVKEKKEKKKVKEAESKNDAPAAPSALPISDKPVTLSFNKGPFKINTGSVTKPLSLGLSLDDAGANAEHEESASEPNKPLVVKKVAPLIASKKTVNNISKWNQVQEELHQKPNVPASTPPAIDPVSSRHTPEKSLAEDSPVPEDEFEFSDMNALMCLLCSRQFKSPEQLKRHNKESDLHKKNFKDVNLRDVARQKVLARKGTANTEQPKYRDRASERRVLFNQPDVPLTDKDMSNTSKKRHAEAPRPPTPPPVVNPGQDENNVGNKLLKMMGWKEGTGLGTDGDGRVDPIQTSVYAQGVGLGASKGKDLSKYTEGYSGYVHMAQEAARERYVG